MPAFTAPLGDANGSQLGFDRDIHRMRGFDHAASDRNILLQRQRGGINHYRCIPGADCPHRMFKALTMVLVDHHGDGGGGGQCAQIANKGVTHKFVLFWMNFQNNR